MLSANQVGWVLPATGGGAASGPGTREDAVPAPERGVLSGEHGDEVGRVPVRDDAAGQRVRLIGAPRREGAPGRGQRIVVGDRVAQNVREDDVLQRDAASGQARPVVRDDVVVDPEPVPAVRGVVTRTRHVVPVDELAADATAVSGPGEVPLDQVRVDRHAPGPGADRGPRGVRDGGLAADEDAAAARGCRLVERLVEDDGVVVDRPVVAEAEVADAATGPVRVVSADPVLRHLVGGRAGAEGDAAARAAEAAVLGDLVVGDQHVVVETVDVLIRAADGLDEGRVTGSDATAEVPGVPDDVVVRDLEPVGVPVDEDRPGVVGAREGEAVDPGVRVVVQEPEDVPSDRVARAEVSARTEDNEAGPLLGGEEGRLGNPGARRLAGKHVPRIRRIGHEGLNPEVPVVNLVVRAPAWRRSWRSRAPVPAASRASS